MKRGVDKQVEECIEMGMEQQMEHIQSLLQMEL